MEDKGFLMSRNIEAMHHIFREQHRQMIDEQKKLLDDYREYFDGVLQQMEASEQPTPSTSENLECGEDAVKEITEIGKLLDDAIKVYGKELAEILKELTKRQQKRNEQQTKEASE